MGNVNRWANTCQSTTEARRGDEELSGAESYLWKSKNIKEKHKAQSALRKNDFEK